MRLRVGFVCICTIVSLLALSSAQLKLGFAVDMPSPSWRTKTAMPTARGQAAIIAGDDGLIYAMGGFAGGAPVSKVEAYNPLTDTWTTKTSMPQAARGAVVARGLDGIIYVVSGATGYLTTVQAYNTTSNTWSTKTSIPSGVWMAGAATGNDGRIYVIGGEPSTYPSPIAINKTQIYDPSTDTWTNGTDMPTARSELGVVKGSDGLIYAMGGYNGSVLSAVEAYDPSTDVWTEKAPMPSPKLEFALVLGPDEKIYVIGGGTSYLNNVGPFFNTVEIYDPKTDVWTIPGWAESIMPTGRKELGAALSTNGRIYAVGGANGAYIVTNEEASIVLPGNIIPTAYIDSMTPNPATRGQTISFVGHGTDSDGSVAVYKWRSSIDGTINASAAFSTSTLTNGTHTIYFSVKDNSGSWSEEVTAIVIVNKPITEDPIYQELLNLNETLNDKVDDLSQQNDALSEQNANLTAKVDGLSQQNDALSEQNANLTAKVDGLSQQNDALSEQNANLTDMIDSLTQKIDTMTLELLAASVIIIVLVIVTIVVTYIRKRK